MRLWRLASGRYPLFDGEGARLYGGRWNTPGAPVIYASEAPATAILEVLVHLDLRPEEFPDDFVLGWLDLEEVSAEHLAADDAKERGLLDNEQRSRAFGDLWVSEARTPLLQVPSAIVPEAANLLLNPNHRELRGRNLTGSRRPFSFDPRLLRAAQT